MVILTGRGSRVTRRQGQLFTIPTHLCIFSILCQVCVPTRNLKAEQRDRSGTRKELLPKACLRPGSIRNV